MKLAVKITLIGIIIMGLVIGIMLFLSVNTIQSGLEQEIGNSQLALAKSTMGKIDRVLFGALQDIKVIAEANPLEASAVARTGIKSKEEIARLDTITTQRLDEFSLSTGPWDELELFSKEGIVVASVNEQEIGENLEESGNNEREAFQKAITGEFFISDLVISSETGKPTITFAAPVRDETISGQPVVGVVIGNFAWPVVEEILQDLGIHHAHLYNQEGYLLATNELHDEPEILKEQNLEIIQHHKIHGGHFGVGLSNEDTFEALQIHIWQEGHLSYKGNDWVLLLETPTDVAFASVKETTQNLLVAGFILLIVTVLVALFVARSISKPIIKLQESAQRISRGNFSEKIEIKTGDEIGKLAETFDNMRYSLKMVIDEYEKMKSKEEMTKKVKSLEKKQAETIKKLRIAIAEQKIASTAEQKALQKYREMRKKSEGLSD
jgi:HAMP domain-containing protein